MALWEPKNIWDTCVSVWNLSKWPLSGLSVWGLDIEHRLLDSDITTVSPWLHKSDDYDLCVVSYGGGWASGLCRVSLHFYLKLFTAKPNATTNPIRLGLFMRPTPHTVPAQSLWYLWACLSSHLFVLHHFALSTVCGHLCATECLLS